jgi:hypothetical protein
MRRTLVVLTLLLAAVPAGAQQRPRSDSLPRELVIALLGGSLGMRQVDIQAGMADDSLPADLFRDALILGFADYRVSKTTVAYFPYTPQATIDTIRARLVAAGWKGPQPQRPDSVRGFVADFGASMPDYICREGSVVHPSVTVRTLNRTLAVINHQRTSGQYSPCNRELPRSPYERMNPAANTPLPMLPAPPGMQGRMTGMGGSLDNDEGLTMETGLSGSSSVAGLLSHYSSLFTAAGWQQVDEVVSKSIGVAAFEITSRGGRFHCSLIVTTPTTDAAHARLALRRK